MNFNVQRPALETESDLQYKGEDLSGAICQRVAEYWDIPVERVCLKEKPLPLPEGEEYSDSLDPLLDNRSCRYLLLHWPLRKANGQPAIKADTYAYVDSMSIASFSGVSVCIHPEAAQSPSDKIQPMLLEALYPHLYTPEPDWAALEECRNYMVSMMEIEVPGIRIGIAGHFPENQFTLGIPGIPAEKVLQSLRTSGIFTHPLEKDSFKLTLSLPRNFPREKCDLLLERMVPICKNHLPEELKPEDPPFPDKVNLEPHCGSCGKENGSSCGGCGKK